jgi:hypothetical protein
MSITAGIIINIIGSISINFGTNLLKYSHLKAQKKAAAAAIELEAERKNESNEMKLTDYSKQSLTIRSESVHTVEVREEAAVSGKQASGAGTRLWYIGFIIFALGNVGNFASFSLAPQSLLASLGSVQFLTNVAFSYFILGTKITFWVIWGTGLILVGNTLVVIFSSKSSGSYTISELLKLYIAPTYSAYLSVLAVGLLVLYFVHNYCKNEQQRYILLKHALQNPFTVPDYILKLEAISYALISGFVGTQSVILAKSSSELLKQTFQGINQFSSPFTYIILISWVSTMVFWLKRMNIALQKFDGVFIIPFLQVIWIVLSIIGGGLYFQEFQNMSGTAIVIFIFGVFLILLGVFCLAPSNPKKKKPQKQKEPTEPLDVPTVDMNLDMDTSIHMKKVESASDPIIISELSLESELSAKRRASKLIHSIVASTMFENISEDDEEEENLELELKLIEEEDTTTKKHQEIQSDPR